MKRKTLAVSIIIAIAGFVFHLGVQQLMRPYAIDGMYYQAWSSEFMMATVSVEDLREAPFASLWNIHTNPPGLDMIRAAFAQIVPAENPRELVRNVDRLLYVLWAALSGLIGALIFFWLADLTAIGYAAAAAVVFIAHPATIYYTAFLDNTILSTALVLAAFVLLWRLRREPGRPVIVIAFSFVVLALFLTRGIFQLPAVIIFAFALYLLRPPLRHVLLFLLICGGLSGLYIAKQYYQFGILSTTSQSGLNLVKSIGYRDNYWQYLDMSEPLPIEQDPSLPSVLVRKRKLTGAPNFNHVRYLQENAYLLQEYWTHLRAMPLSEIADNYYHNMMNYFLPSSQYRNTTFYDAPYYHVIVSRMPAAWREPYDRIFSFPVLPLLLLLSGILWVRRAGRDDYARGLAFLLPGLYIVVVSIIGERGENMRYKYFMEPVLFVFIATQAYLVSVSGIASGRRFIKRLQEGRQTGPG